MIRVSAVRAVCKEAKRGPDSALEVQGGPGGLPGGERSSQCDLKKRGPGHEQHHLPQQLAAATATPPPGSVPLRAE